MNLKFKYSLISICILVFMVGCGKKEYLDDYSGSEEQTDAIQYKQDRFVYLGQSTPQRWASGCNGLYYMAWDDNGRNYNIYYYDYTKQNSGVWCSNITCKHNSKECVAHVDTSCYEEFIAVHNEYVYKIFFDDAGRYLERFSRDGSNQQQLLNLVPDKENVVKVKWGRFYNNRYYYFIENSDKKAVFYSVELVVGATPNKLFELDLEVDGSYVSVFYVNSNMVYASRLTPNVNSSGYERDVYSYNIVQKNLDNILSATHKIRICCNDDFYYTKLDGTIVVVNSNGEEVVLDCGEIPEAARGCSMIANENYIVFDSLSKPRKVVVYDINNKQFNEIEMEDLIALLNDVAKEKNVKEVWFDYAFPIGIDGEYYYLYYHQLKTIAGLKLDKTVDDGKPEYMIIN